MDIAYCKKRRRMEDCTYSQLIDKTKIIVPNLLTQVTTTKNTSQINLKTLECLALKNRHFQNLDILQAF